MASIRFLKTITVPGCRLVRYSSATPGLPHQSSTNPVHNFLASVQLPDIIPDIEPPVQIPYVPDFWDSSKFSNRAGPTEPIPKLILVSGSAANPVGSPSHQFMDTEDSALIEDSTHHDAVFGKGGLIDDAVEDSGITLAEIKHGFAKAFSGFKQ